MSNNPGRDRLREWLDRAAKKQGELAAELGISDAHLSGLLSGRRTPSLALALRIAELTGVPASAWASSEGATA